MKIRIATSIAGHAIPEYGLGDFSFSPSDVVNVHKRLAAAWIENGIATKPDVAAKDVNDDDLAIIDDPAITEPPSPAFVTEETASTSESETVEEGKQ